MIRQSCQSLSSKTAHWSSSVPLPLWVTSCLVSDRDKTKLTYWCTNAGNSARVSHNGEGKDHFLSPSSRQYLHFFKSLIMILTSSFFAIITTLGHAIVHIRSGTHRVTHNLIQYHMCYVAIIYDDITIQWFCDNQYIARQLYNDTSGYLPGEYKMQTSHTWIQNFCFDVV